MRIGIAVVLFCLLVFAIFRGQEAAREALQNRVSAVCESCRLEIGRLRWSLWPVGFSLRDIRFSEGTKEAFATEASAPVATIGIRLGPLLHREIQITFVEIDDLSVTLTDGDGKSPLPLGKHETPTEFLVSKTSVHDGHLTYVRNHEGTHAVLNIRDIELEAEAFGSDPDVADLPVLARASGQIEKTGRVSVSVQATKTKPRSIVTVVSARNQDLADLTPFFKANAGVELKGVLVDGSARSDIRGDRSLSTVRAEYRGLEVHLDKMYDRSDFAAFFMSLGAEIAMHKENLDEPIKVQTRTVRLGREDGESIVSFILQGFKKAAIHVTEASK